MDFSPEEFGDRLQRLRAAMRQASVDVMLIDEIGRAHV